MAMTALTEAAGVGSFTAVDTEPRLRRTDRRNRSTGHNPAIQRLRAAAFEMLDIR
jgi:hypothetical protein